MKTFISPFEVLGMTLSSVLTVAAVLKAHQILVRGYSIGSAFFDWALIAFELSLAVWFLSGRHGKLLKWFGCSVFSVFSLATLHKALSGDASCGCFGEASIDPRLTFAFDFAATVLLALCPPSPARLHPLSRVSGALFIASILFVSLVGGRTSDELRSIEPAEWIGRPMPIADAVRSSHDLSRGHWEIIFYRAGCGDCLDVIEQYAKGIGRSPAGSRPIFVHVPPHGSNSPVEADYPALRFGTLDDSSAWMVETPLYLEIKDLEVKGFKSHTQ